MRAAARRTVPALVLAAVAAGCSLMHQPPTITEPIHLVAVLPIVRLPPTGAPTAGPGIAAAAGMSAPTGGSEIAPGGGAGVAPAAGTSAARGTGTGIAPGAETVVTAQIYAVLSSSTYWRFVPDLATAPAVSALPEGGTLAERARALGKAVGADGELFGTVSRYVERVGAGYGAQHPAAVGFTLQLVSVPSGKVLWKDSFDQQQQPLAWNLFNWWQFWRGGPRWFTAEEFTHLAVEHLLEDLARKLGYT